MGRVPLVFSLLRTYVRRAAAFGWAGSGTAASDGGVGGAARSERHLSASARSLVVRRAQRAGISGTPRLPRRGGNALREALSRRGVPSRAAATTEPAVARLVALVFSLPATEHSPTT